MYTIIIIFHIVIFFMDVYACLCAAAPPCVCNKQSVRVLTRPLTVKHHTVDLRPGFCWSMVQLLSVVSRYQYGNNMPEHTSFSHEHTHGRTEELKCIDYLNNVDAGRENENCVPETSKATCVALGPTLRQV